MNNTEKKLQVIYKPKGLPENWWYVYGIHHDTVTTTYDRTHALGEDYLQIVQAALPQLTFRII